MTRTSKYKHFLAWAQRYPEKRRAHIAVQSALKRGGLFRQPCRGCGNKESVAHHEDYSRPLDVIWLCHGCNAAHHAKRGDFSGPITRTGEANPFAKLTERQVKAIRASTDDTRRLMERYGVSRLTIVRIRNRQTWAHIP